MKAMCKFFGVSRAAYYEWLQKLEEPDADQERLEQVERVYRASHKTYGYRRITIDLQDRLGLSINHKTVLRLMRKLGIRSRARRPKVYKRLEETGVYHRYPNLLARDFSATRPNQKWVTDITFVHTQQGWGYLCAIKDLHDGFIIAHSFERHNSISLVTRTLRQAQQSEKPTGRLILHSDQGTQYTSHAYHLLATEYQITTSMSRRRNCWDNAPMENFFSHLKEEYLRHYPNSTFEEAEQLIREYIHFYNHERIQLKTRQTPYQLRCLSL